MATIISDEIRAALKAGGVWHDFIRDREDLKASEGIGTTAANRKVLARYAEEGKIPASVVPMAKGRGNPNWNAMAGCPGGFVANARTASLADVRRFNADARAVGAVGAGIGVGIPDASRRTVTKETFAGKSCSISAAFMWAYSNLCFADVDPSEAPSAVAWQMLQDMLTSPSLKSEMLRSGLGAAMRRAEAEDETNGRMDGQEAYDLAATFAEEEAKGG